MSNADRQARFVESRSELGELPECASENRRKACEEETELWLRTYFPDIYSLPFCEAQKDYIRDLDTILEHGGLKAVALPRGFGKTSITTGVALKAILTGRRKFLMIVGATEQAGVRIVKDITAMLQSEMLSADYPEYCRPFIALGGRAQRCASQTYHGELTHIQMKTDMIQLPVMGGVADGACIVGRGITGAIRGTHIEVDDKWERPDSVLCDDVQTRESAMSESQTAEREQIILSDVLGLAGHGKQIAAVMCCTVIREGDLSDRFLNRETHPEWRGVRHGIIDTFGGKREKELWENYDLTWKAEQAGRKQLGESNNIYREIRVSIGEICHATNPLLFAVGELDAVQHARNLFLKSDAAFYAEYQNRPLSNRPNKPYNLTIDAVLKHCNGLDRYQLPEDTVAVALCSDINRYSLSFAVGAIRTDGSVSVINYGWWLPKGKQKLWEDNENRETKLREHISMFVDEQLNESHYGRKLDYIIVDAGYSQQTVCDECEELRRKWGREVKIYAAKGFPGDKYDLPRNRKTVFGLGNGVDLRRTFPSGIMMFWDSHQHHLRAQQGFLYPEGTAGCFTVFGDPRKSVAHLPFAEQVVADELECVRPLANGRTYAVFHNSGRKNEMSDCVAELSAVSMLQSVSRLRELSTDKPQRLDKPEEKKEESKDSLNSLRNNNQRFNVRGRGNWASRW